MKEPINIQESLGLDDKSYGKFKLFNRILISYNDFKQAHEITSLIIDQDLYSNYPEENHTLVIALNMAAIVAYSRPFLNSKGNLAHTRLPDKVLKVLDLKEMELHKIIIEDRHTMMAHSDADANLAIPLVLEIGSKSILLPKNASPYATPLLPEAMRLMCNMSFKLQERCFEMRQEMEPEMMKILPKAE